MEIDKEDENEPPGLVVKVSDHLVKLSKKSRAIGREFYKTKNESGVVADDLDPLNEDGHEIMKGLIWKYPKRVLILLTARCASYCRFCTRRRICDIKDSCLTRKQIENICNYLANNKELNEVVISGGDLLVEEKQLIFFISRLVKIKNIKIIRIHTKVPVSDPDMIGEKFYKCLTGIKKQAVYVSIHFEHPDELSKKTLKVIERLRHTGAILLSQSVFLKEK